MGGREGTQRKAGAKETLTEAHPPPTSPEMG